MTPLGYILLPLGLLGLLTSAHRLYCIFVFWTLFSATSVINVGGPDNGSAVQVWMFFGTLWLLRLGLERASLLDFSIDDRVKPMAFWILGFLAVATVSLIMPVLINGRLEIASPILGNDQETPLFLSSHNVTQLLYLVFGGVISICVAHVNLVEKNREETERIFLYAGIFIACWGIFQFFCHVTGIPYPSFLLNNSASGSATGYMQKLDTGISRISSAAVEPSILAQGLVTLLPLTLPAWQKRGFVFSRRRDRLITLLFVVVLLLSTSSTAYVGLVILAATYILYAVRAGSFSKTKAIFVFSLIGVMAIAVVALAFISIPVISQLINTLLLSKAYGGSGVERAMTMALAFGYFQKYPILGIGWGSATSHDVVVFLLSNVGIAGEIVFFCAIFSVVRSNWRRITSHDSPLDLSREAWLMSLVSFMLTSILIGFPLVFGNFWLVLGMAMATGSRSATARDMSVPVGVRRTVRQDTLGTET